MKQLLTYIKEAAGKQNYTCQPKSKFELQQIMIQRIKDEGNKCDLNDIDVSKVKDMSHLFDGLVNTIFKDFNGDISMWDVSNVKTMNQMFSWCKKFNCDISRWNMSNVEDIRYMFYDCKNFNQDLNSWDVSNVEDMFAAFHNCPTHPDWYKEK